MKWEAVQSGKSVWIAISQDLEKHTSLVHFDTTDAQKMAEEYVDWKNRQDNPQAIVTKSCKSYRCHLSVYLEDSGNFTAASLNLPGAGGIGNTEDKAIACMVEAISGVIELCIHNKEKIPWRHDYSIPAGGKQKWIMVSVDSGDKTGD